MGIGSHGRTSIDFYQPWTETAIEQNIKSIKLKRVWLVSCHEFDHSFKCSNNKRLNFAIAFVHSVIAILTHQVSCQLIDIPLASNGLIVISRQFLDRDICQMDFSVSYLALVVTGMCKTCESVPVKIYYKRAVRGDQHVKTDVELFATNQ